MLSSLIITIGILPMTTQPFRGHQLGLLELGELWFGMGIRP